MSGARDWESLKDAFTELVSLPPSERASRLAVLSESDAALGARLEELLRADADADDRLSPFDLLSSPGTTPNEPQPADPFGLAGCTVSHFRILDVLGAGGMGVVYRAHDARLDRTVALKFLLPQYALDPAAKERFLREARAVSALDHPNVCTVHEAGESEDCQPFLAMACYAGETLRDRLARTGPLQIEEALDIARQTVRGLAAAQEAGIVHRDLKPGNLMLARDGTVKVLDFGLAKVADTKHSTPGARAGTAAYMSPEQVAGGPVDHRTDLWSLGVVLHEMLTGRPPFGRGHDAAAMWAILNEVPAPPSSLRAEVPARVDRIVDGLLKKSADERYSRAGDVLADLDAALPSGPARPRAARRPLVAAALIAAIAASALFLTRDRRPAASDEASIAVLPFLDLSNEQQQYFSDGVTEEILNALARINGLHVPARTSSFHFRSRDLPVREIAEQLGVVYVLEGSVRREGEEVRITATLVDARTERRLWSETFETDDGDVFDAQQRIADAVADALELRLAPGTVVQMASRNPAAHDLYLQGLFHWNRRSPRDMENAIRLLEQAVALDSAYARSWAGLALVYAASHATLPPLMPPDESLRRTEAAARRALALDSSLADAHSALGYAYHWHWRWDDAERELTRALVLEPQSARALHWYGEHLGKMGRGPEAVTLTRRAISLDPFSLVLQSDLGLAVSRDGRIEEAIVQYESARERDPGIVMPHIMLHRLYLVQGDVEASAAAGRRWAELTGAADADELGTLARAKRDPALRPAAFAILDRWAQGPASLLPDIALYSAQLGDHPRALDALERAYAARNPFLANLRTASWYDPLRGQPRFERLIEAMKYPPLRARQPD